MSYSSEVLADSPLLYVRFEETAGATCANSGSLGGNATATGSFTRNYSTGFTGLGVGLDCGASAALATYPDTSSLDLTGDMTYECWVKADSLQAAVVMSKGSDSSGSSGGYELQLRAAGNIRLLQSTVSILVTGSAGAYAPGVWSHLAITRSGNVYSVYSNGSLTDSITTAVSPNATAKSFCIGGQDIGGGPTNVYAGKIDEVAVYGSALSAARIAAHYAARQNNATDPIFKAAGTYTEVSSTGSISVPAPLGVATGDLLVIMVTSFNGTAFSTPAGWTQIAQTNNPFTDGYSWAVFYKLSPSSSPGSTTVSMSGSPSGISAQMWAYENVNQSTPIDGSSTWLTNTATTTPSMPSITTSANNTLIVYAVGDEGNNLFTTPPTGTAFKNQRDTVQSCKHVEADGLKATAGTQSGLTLTKASTSRNASLAFGVKSAAVATFSGSSTVSLTATITTSGTVSIPVLGVSSVVETVTITTRGRLVLILAPSPSGSLVLTPAAPGALTLVPTSPH